MGAVDHTTEVCRLLAVLRLPANASGPDCSLPSLRPNCKPQVLQADIKACSALVHVIDTVLIPAL